MTETVITTPAPYVNPDFVRHSSWLPYTRRPPVYIVGCGAVGSHVAMLLARLGFEDFHLFDGDKVEALNLANQAFCRFDVGKLKTDALRDQLLNFSSNIEITTHGLFTGETEIEKGYVFCGVDSFSARRMVLDRCIQLLEQGKEIYSFTDFRLGFNYGRSYLIDFYSAEAKEDVANYALSIGDDKLVTDLACTEKICPGPVMLVSAIGVQATMEAIRKNTHLLPTDSNYSGPHTMRFDMSDGNISVKTYNHQDKEK